MKSMKVKDLTIEEFKTLVSDTIKESLEDIIEDLIALTSEEFLKSIEEARRDYREGRVKRLEDALNV